MTPPPPGRCSAPSDGWPSTDRHYKFMEVCGGHTHTIYRHGIEHLLPSSVELVHGPGCPVCVIPMGRIDDAMWLAEQPDVIFTCFGDMMRVPGSNGSLLDAKARGADVRFVYSPLDALKIAVNHPEKQVVFFALGFETTAPSTAVTLVRARELGLANFSVFCNHVTIVPPIKAILESPDLRLDGFLGPGHVSTVVGNRPYRFVPEVYGKPLVVAGFEPLDILASVAMLLAQTARGPVRGGEPVLARRRRGGQPRRARADGAGVRAAAALRVAGARVHRAERAEAVATPTPSSTPSCAGRMPGVRVADPKACQCGEVLKGVLKPWECKVFGTACTPETPIGTCMVSPGGRLRGLLQLRADAPGGGAACRPPFMSDRHHRGRRALRPLRRRAQRAGLLRPARGRSARRRRRSGRPRGGSPACGPTCRCSPG